MLIILGNYTSLLIDMFLAQILLMEYLMNMIKIHQFTIFFIKIQQGSNGGIKNQVPSSSLSWEQNNMIHFMKLQFMCILKISLMILILVNVLLLNLPKKSIALIVDMLLILISELPILLQIDFIITKENIFILLLFSLKATQMKYSFMMLRIK